MNLEDLNKHLELVQKFQNAQELYQFLQTGGSTVMWLGLTWSLEQHQQANALKYIIRWKHKNGVEDLKKARWYLERLIMERENG